MNKIKKILPIILACVLVFGSCLTVSAEENNRVLELDNNIYKNGYNYMCSKIPSLDFKYFLKPSGANHAIYSTYPFISDDGSRFYVSEKSNMVSVYFNDSGNVEKYSTYSGNSSDKSGYILASTYGSSVQFMTSHDIRDFSGNVVFRLPVVPIAQKAEELPEMVNNQIAVILTIAVACLALLVTLSVLRKKLPSFL